MDQTKLQMFHRSLAEDARRGPLPSATENWAPVMLDREYQQFVKEKLRAAAEQDKPPAVRRLAG